MNGKYGIICGPMAVLLTREGCIECTPVRRIHQIYTTETIIMKSYYLHFSFDLKRKLHPNLSKQFVCCRVGHVLFKRTHTDDARKPVNLTGGSGGFAWVAQLRND